MLKMKKLLESFLIEAEPETEGLVNINDGPDAVLAAASKIPQDVLKAGETDAAGPDDEKIEIKAGSKAANALKPMQNEIGTSNSLADQLVNRYGAFDKAMAGENLGKPPGFPILTFKGKYILDGHHRWSQFVAANPGGSVAIADIKADGVEDGADALALVHTILFALYGKSPTKKFEGENMMGWDANKIYSYIMERSLKDQPSKDMPSEDEMNGPISKEVLSKLMAAGKIEEETPEQGAMYFANNLSGIIKGGEFSRTSMPQGGDAGSPDGLTTSTPEMEKGAINYKSPKKADAENAGYTPSGKLVEHFQKIANIKKG